MRIRSHTGLLAALGLSVGGLTALALSVSAGAASGQVCMGIVIQDGSSSTPSVQAANVTPGTTSDLEALVAAGDTYIPNDSGLVCDINDYPSNEVTGCLNAKGGKFFYWSYWQGNPDTNTWTYASVGPASHDVSAGQDYVEGWRYQDPGFDNPNAEKPTVTPASAFAQTCPATTTPTTSGGGGGSPGGGGGSGAPTPSTAPTTAPTTQPTTAAASGTVPHNSESPRAATTTTRARGLAGTAPPTAQASTSTTTSSAAVGSGSHQKTPTSPTKLAEANASAHGQSGGDPVLPIIIVALVILLLGGVSWFRWRRRPAEE
jgi:hypothetical protein